MLKTLDLYDPEVPALNLPFHHKLDFFAVVPNSTPPRFVNSQLVRLLSLGNLIGSFVEFQEIFVVFRVYNMVLKSSNGESTLHTIKAILKAWGHL